MIDSHSGYSPSSTMKELIRDNAMMLPAISRFGIAFGFGDAAVAQVCRDNNVDINTFLCVVNLLGGRPYDASAISLPGLMDYLERAHSSFLDIELPKIRHHLIDAINYSASNEVALLMMKFFDDYVVEVRKHMEYENTVIFSYVNNLLRGYSDSAFSIADYSANHSDTVAKLNQLKDIFIYHYKQKDNARLSGALLDINICEKDMLSHFDVERELLIPAVEKLERTLHDRAATVGRTIDRHEPVEANSLELLSEREQDVIRGIARGKANKEIADELFISVHTVATHRRNICSKLGIHTTAGLTVFAIINHMIELP